MLACILSKLVTLLEDVLCRVLLQGPKDKEDIQRISDRDFGAFKMSLISSYVVACLRLTYGLMYPAYCSYKAVKTKDVREYVHWMMYWIAFAAFSVIEVFADTFVGCWFPFYYEGKILFLLWMISSSTRGGAIMYRRYIHPTLTKHEAEIDACLADFKVKASGAVMTWGYRAVTSLTDVVMSATLRAGEPMMDHFRRTYSMNDLNRASNAQYRGPVTGRQDYTDGLMPRSISGGDFYFERNLPVQGTVITEMEQDEIMPPPAQMAQPGASTSSERSSPEFQAPPGPESRRLRTRSRTRKAPTDMGPAGAGTKRRVKTKKTDRSTEKNA